MTPCSAKLIVHRDTRDQAIRTMSRALDEFVIVGSAHDNGSVLSRGTESTSTSSKGNLDTGFIEEYLIDA